MPLSFSFEMPTHRVDQATEFVTGEAVTALAQAAERAGFAAVHVTDHPAPDGKWLDMGGHHALDPFVALAFAAAGTTDIRLLTNIYVAAYRNPFLGAKMIHSLVLLSGERLILGTASGYLKPEFSALGVDFSTRAALLDEALAILRQTLTGEDVAAEGKTFSARGVRFRPVPGEGAPPIWIGGNSSTAVRRAVTLHQGWAPFITAGYAAASRTAAIDSVEDLEAAIGRARALADEVGRTAPLDICLSAGPLIDPGLSVEQRRDTLGRLEAIGVTWIPVSLPGDTREGLIESANRFADLFIT